jgi:hypothetical protein
METARGDAKTQESNGGVYRAFLRLDRERRRVALRILSHEKVLADLYDHFLIEKSLMEPGRSTSWDSYRAKSQPSAL